VLAWWGLGSGLAGSRRSRYREALSIGELLVRHVWPAPVADYAPLPRIVADGIWVVDRRLRMGGVTMPTRMTVVRLRTGGLLLHSPVRLDAPTREGIASLGRVDALVAPNSFHYLFLGEHAAAHPTATVHLAPGLRERRPELSAGTVLGDEPPAAWAADVEQLVFGPIRGLSEVVFFHRATATLILTDLAFGLAGPRSLLERTAWRIMGVGRSFGPSRTGRLIFLRDAKWSAPLLSRILAWPFERIVVAHGAIVERDARETFRRGFAPYLPIT
jgi:hypothetical protein